MSKHKDHYIIVDDPTDNKPLTEKEKELLRKWIKEIEELNHEGEK